MNCEKCGKIIPENIDYCPTCKIESVKVNEVDNEKNKIINSQNPYNFQKGNSNKLKDKMPIISFILALIPYVIFLGCLIATGAKLPDTTTSPIWWILGVYFWSVGHFVYIASIVTAIIGIKSQNKTFSYTALFLDFLPIVILLVMLIMGI